QLSVHFAIQSEDLARAAEGDEFHVARVAGLEADGGAGGDVEAEAARAFPVECERLIHFVEMEVAADLDRAVAGVGDADDFRGELEIRGKSGGVFGDDDFSGDHGRLTNGGRRMTNEMERTTMRLRVGTFDLRP